MKNQINEAKRFQELAGLINENEKELSQFSGGMEVTIKVPEKIVEWCREELGWEDDKIKQVFIDYIEYESQPLQHRVIIRNFENFVGTRIGSKGFQINKKNLLNKK